MALLPCGAVPAHAGPTGPVGIAIGSVYAAPAARAELDVRLRSDGRRLGTLRHALSRPATLAFDTDAGTPECTPGAAAASASFAFTPAGCAGDACLGIEARLTFSGETPDDVLAYRCRVRTPAQDVGTCEHVFGCADGEATLAINVDAAEGFAGRYSILDADDLLAGELVQPPVRSGETGFAVAAVCDGAAEGRVSLYDEVTGGCPVPPAPAIATATARCRWTS